MKPPCCNYDPSRPDDQWPVPEDFHSTDELSDVMEVSKNPSLTGCVATSGRASKGQAHSPAE